MLAWALDDKCMPLYHYAIATDMHWMGPRADLDAIDNRNGRWTLIPAYSLVSTLTEIF
jgi:hypothetical protein